jgi:LPS export ABC transporter protein LptC
MTAALAACNDSTAPGTQDFESLPADQVVMDMEHFITSDGVRRAHLVADTAYLYEDSTTTQLRVVRLEMFDNAGNPTSTLTSDQGVYNSATQKTVARGNVVLVMPGPDGRTIWTEELHYDPTTKRIWSDVPTRVLQAGGEELHGEGFTADDQFVNVNIIGGAGTNLPLPLNRR